MTRVSIPEIAPRLLAAPRPLREESLASWIQRVAGAHQYSMPRLREIFGVDAVGNDWDARMGETSWNRIVQVMGIDPGPQRRALRTLSSMCAVHPAASLLLTSERKPRYRWCVRCLASDHAPYLRWHWRLAEVEWCWTHEQKLEDACLWCQAPMHVHRARLVMVGRVGRAVTLADCDLCGGPLALSSAQIDSPFTAYQWRLRDALEPLQGNGAEIPMQHVHAAVDRFLEVLRDKFVAQEIPVKKQRATVKEQEATIKAQKATVEEQRATVKKQKALVKKQRAMAKKQKATVKRRRSNALSRALACNARLRVLREKVLEWRLDARSFVIGAATAAPLARRVVHWSWSLSAEGRGAVAKALWAVRSEMRSAPFRQDEGPSP